MKTEKEYVTILIVDNESDAEALLCEKAKETTSVLTFVLVETPNSWRLFIPQEITGKVYDRKFKHLLTEINSGTCCHLRTLPQHPQFLRIANINKSSKSQMMDACKAFGSKERATVTIRDFRKTWIEKITEAIFRKFNRLFQTS